MRLVSRLFELYRGGIYHCLLKGRHNTIIQLLLEQANKKTHLNDGSFELFVPLV